MKDAEQKQTFTRRAFILGGIQGLLGLGLLGRLYTLQVLNRKHYQLLSDKNSKQSFNILPVRGEIFDRSGVLLAGNKESYSCLLAAKSKEEFQEILNKINALAPLSDESLERHLQYIKKSPKGKFNGDFAILIKDNLTWEELSKLEVNSVDLPGIIIEKSHSRVYLNAPSIAHVVGYVGPATEAETLSSPDLDIPGLNVGKIGIEKSRDDILRGQPGMKDVEVNASQKIVRVLSTSPSVKGADLNLTIDLALQKETEKILSTRPSASAVVMDPYTGAVLSLASNPSFDTNNFIGGISKNNWAKLINNPYKPLLNKATGGLYAPGSTFKMIVGLAALKRGLINSKTCFSCPGHYDFYNHRFHCHSWRYGGHGQVNLEKALIQSCDVFFYHLGTMMGADAMAEAAQEFGLGIATGIELPSEKAGLVPNKTWKLKNKNQAWTPGDTINMSIGQGAMLSTPVQLAKMMAILVNGMQPVTPHLIKGRIAKPTKPPKVLNYTEEFQQLIKLGMYGVVNNPGGTAYGARPNSSSWQMAGKTGSSQVSRITLKQRENKTLNDRPYELREHAVFTGYAPFSNPKYVVSVVVEHGGSGGKVAAPIGRDILAAASLLL